MELFPITLPKQNICTETALYYRANHAVAYDAWTGSITMQKDTILSLDTYFNCFSYSKYLQYTYATVLEVHLQVQGDVQVRIMKAELQDGTIHRTEKLVQRIQHAQMEDTILVYDFSNETGHGILYIEAKALSETATIQFGYYGSPIPAVQQNHTKLAAVICTYKREAYVKRNLQHLTETILADEAVRNHIEILVIDNGKTLNKEEIETDTIKLYPNKNCGGSGGFTRGMLEALNRKEEFSHVLLMDDDILIESNVLVKTIRFLQIVREEQKDLSIGGSMLRLDHMTTQHEAGGRWTGITVKGRLSNLELINTVNLLKMEMNTEKADFCGWWYCCIPICILDDNNLPLPLFIKIDDIEYGLRVTKKLDFLNGIGVWHEPFQNKENTMLHYYNVRNKLIVNSIYKQDCQFGKTMFLLAYYIGKILLSDQYYTVQYPLSGFADYLKGSEWLRELQPEEQHTKLIAMQKQLQAERKKCRSYYYVKAGCTYIKYTLLFLKKRKLLMKEYQSSLEILTSMDFWYTLLEMKDWTLYEHNEIVSTT